MSTWQHDNNVEAEPDGKYCYATGEVTHEGLSYLVGCCLYDDRYFPNHDYENGFVLHVDPDLGTFHA